MTKHCVPCEDKTGGLDEGAITELLQNLPGWKLHEFAGVPKLVKEYTCKSFVLGIDFVRAVADIAEEEGHHPDIEIHYNKVTFLLYTHSINALSENDGIIAERIEAIASLFI